MPPPAAPLRAAPATEIRHVESTDPHVLAVDLGTGGPKVAVLASTGRIVAHAFQAVGIDLTEDGGAEQSPQAWWDAIVASARRGAGRQRRGARATSSASAAPPSGRAPCPSTTPGRPSARPSAGWTPGAPAPSARPCAARSTSRATPPPSWRDGCAAPAASRACRARTRWATSTSCASSAPTSTPPPRSSSSRSTTSTCASPGWPGPRTTPSPCTGSPTTATSTPSPTTTRSIGLAGLERSKLPDLVPTGSVLGGLAPAAGRRARAAAGHPGRRRHGGPALGRRRLGRRGRLRRPPLHRHLELDQLPRPLQEDRRADQHRVHPLGDPGPLPGGRRARDGGRLPDLAARQPALPRRRPVATAPVRRRAARSVPTPSDFFGTLNDVASSVPVGSHGVLFTPWLNGERSPVDDHTIRGGFHNISLSSTRADMVRAVFEGVALNSAWLLGAVEKFCKRRFDSLAFVGGGANSDLWSQIHADATGRTIRQIEDPVLANVRGAGLLTLLALGHLTHRRHPRHRDGQGHLRARPRRRRGLRRAAQGVRQPLREDEGDPQATQRAPPAPVTTAGT